MGEDRTRLAPETPSEPPELEGLPKIGEVVAGKYEVEEILGAGGMGIVVAAKNVLLGERIAIKFLSPKALRDKEAIARFVREARTAAKIRSEHIARVMDIGTIESSGAPYIVMECLDGRDLGSLLTTHGHFPVAEAVDYVLQACIAIAEAHALGIVHRDLKPSNLFLTARSDGAPLVKVLDFGISKAIDAELHGTRETDLTDTRSVFGSPSYMSPEQVRSAKNVDARTDVWSLGVIMFELLAGSLPFKAETSAGMLASIAADEPASLRDVREEVPADLEHAVMRALRKDLTRRYASVADFARALEPFAPDGRALVERIVRLSTGGSGRFPPRRSSRPPPAAAFAATEKPVTISGTSRRGRNATPLLVGAAFVLASGVLVALLVRPHAPPASSASAVPAATSRETPTIPGPLTTPAPIPQPSPATPTAGAVPGPSSPDAPSTVNGNANAVASTAPPLPRPPARFGQRPPHPLPPPTPPPTVSAPPPPKPVVDPAGDSH